MMSRQNTCVHWPTHPDFWRGNLHEQLGVVAIVHLKYFSTVTVLTVSRQFMHGIPL